MTYAGEELEGVVLTETADGLELAVRVPAEILGDGVTTVLVTDAASGARLGSFAILAGEAVEGDLRAELDLMRAELDMLKKAFRRLASRG